jgi:hypothetical protein
MLKISASGRPMQAANLRASVTSVATPRKRDLIYSQLRNTTRRLVHPFVMVMGWPSATTIYHRRRLLEASIVGLFLTTMVFAAILLCVWFAPPPPLMVSLGADEVSVVQISPTAAPPTSTPTPFPPTPTPAYAAVSTPYDPQIYLP